MSSSLQNLSSKQHSEIKDADQFRIGIAVAEWNEHITQPLLQACIETLQNNGVTKQNVITISVPGSFELITAARILLDSSKLDTIICIGCVIKGDTPHFEYVCNGVTNGIAQLNAMQQVPVIFGVLTVNNEQQAIDRCGGIHGNKGHEAAYTALKMASIRKQLLNI